MGPVVYVVVVVGAASCRFGHSDDTDKYCVGLRDIPIRVHAAADIDTDTYADRLSVISSLFSSSVRWYVIPLLVTQRK